MANFRLGVLLGNMGKVALGGVALLLIGAGIGFFAETLGKRITPDHPERVPVYRFVGLGLALIGTVWALWLGH